MIVGLIGANGVTGAGDIEVFPAVESFWRHTGGRGPIEKSNLNLQWAYDNRRTLRMMPNINQ